MSDRAPRLALWLALALLAAARAGAAFVPDMRAWALNDLRFVDPVTGWLVWSLAALALVPAVSRRAAVVLDRAGDALAHGGMLPLLVCATAAAALVWLLPDRVRFVGDFLLRQGAVEQGGPPGTLFPQALPLDVLLHYRWPTQLVNGGTMDANTAARVLGALETACFAALAVTFSRVLALRGAAAAATAAVVFCGGYLGMFTGYGKAFSEMVLFVAALGVFGLRAIRGGAANDRMSDAALWAAGAVVAVALVVHRSALGLLPPLVFVWVLWIRDRRAAAVARPLAIAALLVPLLALVAMAPRIASTMLSYDTRVHFETAEVRAAGGALSAVFAGRRPLDLLNLVALLSPLAFVAPFLAVALGRRVWRRDFLFLVILAAPLVVVMPLIHPVGGLHRDWDVFTFTGVSLSLLTAWLVAEALRGAREPLAARAPKRERSRRSRRMVREDPPPDPRHAWLALAVVLGVAAPAGQWLVLHAEGGRGAARVRAFVTEPPPRSEADRGRTWDYLGIRGFQLEDWEASATAFEQAARFSPSPRILQQWALAETQRGHLDAAQRVYERLLQKSPRNTLGWLGLAAVSTRIGDIQEARRAALAVLKIDKNDPRPLEVLRYIDEMPQAVRDSLTRSYPPRQSGPNAQ